MGKKVESYESDDGRLFKTEREMVLHEIDITVRKEFPALKIGLGAISQNADRLLEILQPLAACPPKNHPEVPAQTTLGPPVAEEPDCTCGVSMNTPRNHHRTCPVYRALFPTGRQIYEASKKPKLDVCRPVAKAAHG